MLLDCFTWWRTRHPNTLLLTVISTLPQQILWGITATTIFSQQNQICRVLLWITSALYAVIPPLSSVLAAKWFDTGKNWFFMGYVVWVFSHINNYHCSSFGNWTVYFYFLFIFNKKYLLKLVSDYTNTLTYEFYGSYYLSIVVLLRWLNFVLYFLYLITNAQII